MRLLFGLAVIPLTLLTACNETVAHARRPSLEAVVRPVNASFAEAGDGMVIPDFKPDEETLAFASHCAGGTARSVAMGMSECDLIALKGTPSRVVAGLDQNGNAHNAVWYVEGGVRTVYKFDDSKLVDIIR
jgi:hypothetical protein